MKCPYCKYTGVSQLEIDLYECHMCGERFTEAEAEVIIPEPKPSFIKRIINLIKNFFRRIFKGVR